MSIKFNFPTALELILAKADIVEEASATVTYLGYAAKGNPATSASSWAVCKVTQSGSSYPITTTIQWSNASFNKDQIWDDRTSLTYQYKNF